VLHVPAQDDLCGGLATRLGDTADCVVGQWLAVVSQRAVCLDCDAELRSGLACNAIREERVQLELIDRRNDAGGVDDARQVGGLEI
jgi:hypothetical protein